MGRALAWDLGDLGSVPGSTTVYLVTMDNSLNLSVPRFSICKIGTTAQPYLTGKLGR